MPDTRASKSAELLNEEELRERRATLDREFSILQKQKREREKEDTRLREEREKLRRDQELNERTKKDLEEIKANLETTRAEMSEQHERIGACSGLPPNPPRLGPTSPQRPRFYDAHTSAIYPPHDLTTENYGPRISFREALETVPHFDGHNIPVSQFIRACRRAKEILPPSSERNLTRLLLTKLRGRAIFAVEDEGCETITQLSDLLNGAFGAPRTIDQYRGELSTIHLRPGEHILDYIARVKDLRSSILDAERRDHGIPNAPAETDALTARSFCDGLPLSYRIQLRPEHFSNPFAAFTHVKTLAKRQEIDNSRFENPRKNDRERSLERNIYSTGRPLAISTPIKPFSERTETNRERYGSPRVTFRNPPDNRYTPKPRYENTNPSRYEGSNRPRYEKTGRDHTEYPNRSRTETPGGNNKICRYCKNPGHEIEECRKRQYNNSRQAQGNSPSPSRTADEPRAGTSRENSRPIRAITETQDELPESQQ